MINLLASGGVSNIKDLTPVILATPSATAVAKALKTGVEMPGKLAFWSNVWPWVLIILAIFVILWILTRKRGKKGKRG